MNFSRPQSTKRRSSPPFHFLLSKNEVSKDMILSFYVFFQGGTSKYRISREKRKKFRARLKGTFGLLTGGIFRGIAKITCASGGSPQISSFERGIEEFQYPPKVPKTPILLFFHTFFCDFLQCAL